MKKVILFRYLGLGLFALACSVCFASSSSVSAATITVNTTVDEVDWAAPNTNCSFREALASMNGAANFGGCIASGTYATLPTDTDTITVPSGTYPVTDTGHNFVIGQQVPNGVFTALILPMRNTKLNINGDPAGGTIISNTTSIPLDASDFFLTVSNITIDGGSTSTVALLTNGSPNPSTYNNITLRNGSIGFSRLSYGNPAPAITFNNSWFHNLTDTALINNECVGSAIINNNSIYINNSVFDNNGVAISECGHIELKNSQITNNTSTTATESVHIFGTLVGATDVIENNTFYNNSGSQAATLGISTAYVGEIATVILNNNTFFGNTGSVANDLNIESPQVTATNNLLVNSATTASCVLSQPLLVNQSNYSYSSSCTGFASTTFPASGISSTLVVNGNTRANVGSGGLGGKTKTLALTPTSPALDTGNNSTCATTDQNGIARPQVTTCDVGAYERLGTANIFDPPSAYKTVSPSGELQIEWKMVWLNDGNTLSELVNIQDPLSAGLTFVPGSLVCVTNGASIQQLCTYDSVTNQVLWNGFIAPDPGATTEANALNEVVITFKTNYLVSQSQFTNQAIAFWDENTDGVISNLDNNKLLNTPVTTDGDNSISGKQTTLYSRVLSSTGLNLETTSLLSLTGLALIVSITCIRIRSSIKSSTKKSLLS